MAVKRDFFFFYYESYNRLLFLCRPFLLLDYNLTYLVLDILPQDRFRG